MSDEQAGSPHVSWAPGLASLPPAGEGMTRKGDAARKALDSTDPDWDLVVAMDRLAWLADHGALGGVDEILRERCRRIRLGKDAGFDDRYVSGELYQAAEDSLRWLTESTADGTAGYPEAEEALREAGALVAAELDRLYRMLAG